MIIGTAGHIDHGKTALIRALTGIDADRLAEEKQRGLTIDLGFAYQPLDNDDVLGFVDVPGHERFVANMLSGALAVDYVLLVVAADDGPMPQSVEHLAIIDLLGLTRGAVALTKIDRVNDAREAAARDEVRQLLAGTGLAGADIFPVSSVTGQGVQSLRERLLTIARARSPRPRGGYCRLAIDRVFSLSGAGTVVTGTVHSGTVAVGDRLVLSPRGPQARVRGIHRQNRAAETAAAGDRCALNLAGRRLDRRALRRGDWALAPAVASPSDRLDGEMRLLAGEARALAHWSPVHVHIGAADIAGRVAVLDGERVEPGARACVQLVLERAVPALWGDRFILRDQSATRTLGGGRLLDAFAPGRGRRRCDRLAVLAALADPPAAALPALLAARGIAGMDLAWFERNGNLTPAEARACYAQTPAAQIVVDGRPRAFARPVWQRLSAAIVAAVDQHHQRAPDSPGLPEPALAASLRITRQQRPPAPVLAAAVAELTTAGTLARRGQRLCLPAHRVPLSPAQRDLWAAIEPKLAADGLRPPRVRELAASFNQSRDALRLLLALQADAGRLWRVSDELFYPPATIAALAAATQKVGEADAGHLTVRSFRDGTGVSRNVALELLEFFDRTGLTARVADGRRLRGEAAALYGRADQAI